MKKKSSSWLLVSVVMGGAAVLLAAAMASLLAYGIVSEFVTRDLAEILVPVIIAVSVFVTSLISGANSGQQGRGLAALCSAGVYFLLCVLAKVLVFPGNTQYLLRNFIACAAAAICAVVVSAQWNGRKKKVYTRKKR